MSKKRKRRLALAVCAAAVAAMLFIWSFTSLGARLCFTARILAALPDAGKEAEDGLSEDGSQLMFRNQQTLALLAELALTGKYEDLTGCQMTTWESPCIGSMILRWAAKECCSIRTWAGFTWWSPEIPP